MPSKDCWQMHSNIIFLPSFHLRTETASPSTRCREWYFGCSITQIAPKVLSFQEVTRSSDGLWKNIFWRRWEHTEWIRKNGMSFLIFNHFLNRLISFALLSRCYFFFSSARMLSIPAKEKVPISHLVTEVMFGELFRLPASDFPEVFFTSVFIELCKLQPSNMPQVVSFLCVISYI